MDYTLLRNKIYLILLAYYNNEKMPTYTKLGELAGMTRQTAQKKVAQLINDQLISVGIDSIEVVNKLNLNIEILKNYLDTNNDFDPIALKMLLFPQHYDSRKSAGEDLGYSREGTYQLPHGIVYGIISEGKIKYIGTTKHFERRIKEHIKKRPFLKPEDFCILVDDVGSKGYNVELELIHILDPEWNQAGKAIK